MTHEQRIVNAALAIRWLEANPDDYAAILVCARLSLGEGGSLEMLEGSVLAGMMEAGTRSLQSGKVVRCGECAYAVAVFYTGGAAMRTVDWPELTPHGCAADRCHGCEKRVIPYYDRWGMGTGQAANWPELTLHDCAAVPIPKPVAQAQNARTFPIRKPTEGRLI